MSAQFMVQNKGGRPCIELAGEALNGGSLTPDEEQELHTVINEMCREPCIQSVLFDLTTARLLSSSSIGLLIALHRKLRGVSKQLIIRCPNGPVLQQLARTKVKDLLNIEPPVRAHLEQTA